MEVRSLNVHEPSEQADSLLDCLRAKAEPYGVGIQEGNTGSLRVNDLGGSTSGDLRAFLAAQLDECGRELELDWRDFLSIAS